MEDVSNSVYVNHINNMLTKMYYRFTIREFLLMLVMVFIVVNIMNVDDIKRNVKNDYIVPTITGVVVYIMTLVT